MKKLMKKFSVAEMTAEIVEKLRDIESGEYTPSWRLRSVCEVLEIYGLEGLGLYCIAADYPKAEEVESQNDGMLMCPYPVPYEDGTMSAQAAFAHEHNFWEGEYGANRREYAGWLADALESGDYV